MQWCKSIQTICIKVLDRIFYFFYQKKNIIDHIGLLTEQEIGNTIENVRQTIEHVTRPTSMHVQQQSGPTDSNEGNDA